MMAQLLDLPAELLSLVLAEVGGGELRKDIRKLTICRKWYDAALEVFLSGRHLRDIKLRGCNINRLSDVGSYSGQRMLMHKNTRNLDIRLLGHWRDESSHDDFALYADDTEGLEHGKKDREGLDNDPYVFGQRSEFEALQDWHAYMKSRLAGLFRDLSHFKFLESFTFETLAGTQNNGSSIEYYFGGELRSMMLSGLLQMQSLKRLTLDLCTEVPEDSMDIHICPLIAKLLPRVEEIRLRTRVLCPEIFKLENDFGATDVKLKGLVVKLHLPMDASRLRGDPGSMKARPCKQGDLLHHRRMVDSAQQFLIDLAALHAPISAPDVPEQVPSTSNLPKHGVQLCRISFVDDSCSLTLAPRIYVVDCLTGAQGWPVKGWLSQEFLPHQDDGTPWWFEEDDDEHDDEIAWSEERLFALPGTVM